VVGAGLRSLPAKQHASTARPTTNHGGWPAAGLPGNDEDAASCAPRSHGEVGPSSCLEGVPRNGLGRFEFAARHGLGEPALLPSVLPPPQACERHEDGRADQTEQEQIDTEDSRIPSHMLAIALACHYQCPIRRRPIRTDFPGRSPSMPGRPSSANGRGASTCLGIPITTQPLIRALLQTCHTDATPAHSALEPAANGRHICARITHDRQRPALRSTRNRPRTAVQGCALGPLCPGDS
jgi:hypothetical protein